MTPDELAKGRERLRRLHPDDWHVIERYLELPDSEVSGPVTVDQATGGRRQAGQRWTFGGGPKIRLEWQAPAWGEQTRASRRRR